MIVVDDHRPLGAEQLQTVGLAERGIARRQRVADPEIDHRAIGKREDRPGHVVGAVAGLLENAVLRPRHDLDGPVAFEKPAHQIDIIGEHIEHRRGVRVALENGECLRAGIVDARHAADDSAETAVPHLLLGAQEALFVAAAIADAKLAFGGMQRIEDLVGLGERKSDRFLHQHWLAELQSVQHGLRVLLFGR